MHKGTLVDILFESSETSQRQARPIKAEKV